MNIKSLFVTGALFFAGALATQAADQTAASADKQLQIFPMNLARQGMGANLFAFDSISQSYVPTQAAAAWLDDDATTAWPPSPGKSYYLLSFPRAEAITNFAISAKAGSSGTVSLYASDTLALPSANSWTSVAKDIDIEAINNKTMAKPFNIVAKYLLIEANSADPAPWYSLQVYGATPSISYHLQKRATPISDKDLTSMYGAYVNNGTMFNLSSLYAGASVVYSNLASGAVELQKAIDGNPETAATIAPSKNEAGLVVHFGDARQLQRISVMTNPGAKGKLDFFLVGALPGTNAQAKDADAQFLKVANTIPAANAPAPLDSLSPNATLVLDGSGRGSIDFPAVTASYMIVRWTPETAGQNLSLAELNSFGDFSLGAYELVTDAAPMLAGQPNGDMSKDSKDKNPPGVFQGPDDTNTTTKDPFLPGGLGFPPNLTHLISP